MENTEWFQKYFDNELSESELKKFQSMLDDNPDFKEEYEIYQHVISYNDSKAKKINALLTLNEVKENYQLSSKRTWIDRYKFSILLVAIFLMVISGYYFFKMNNTNDSARNYAALTEKYFQPNQISLTEKSNENQTQNQIQIELAVESFNSHDYKKTLTLMSNLDITAHKDKGILLLMKGISEAQESNCKKAISILEGLSLEFDLFSNETNYYIALCYIKSNDLISAKKSLSNIAPDSNLHSKSVSLIAELEKK